MPLIRSVEETRERLGYSAEDDRDIAIESHLETAVETISDQIRTEIDRADIVDTFFVRFSLRDSNSAYSSNRRPSAARTGGTGINTGSAATVQLLLSRGFMDSGEAITVYAAGTEDALSDDALRTNLMNASGTNIDYTSFEYERGILRVNDFGLDGVYVRVTYKAGFLDDDASPPVFQDTPAWLIRAADLETRILVNSDAVFGRDDVRTEEQNRLELRLSKMLMKHARYIPTAEKPVHSVATASAT